MTQTEPRTEPRINTHTHKHKHTLQRQPVCQHISKYSGTTLHTLAYNHRQQCRAHAHHAHATSHTPTQHTSASPARMHNVPRGCSDSAVREHHCTTTARTAHTTQRATHTAPTEKHTPTHARLPRHTHRRAVRLPSVDGMLPESWLLDEYNSLQDTRTAITSHHGTLLHPASRPPHISAHRIPAIKSNQTKSN